MRSWDGMMGLDWKSRSDDVQTEFQLIDSSENTGKEQTLSKAVQDFSSPAAVAVPRGLPLIRLHSILFSLLLPHQTDLAIDPMMPRGTPAVVFFGAAAPQSHMNFHMKAP